MPQVTVIADVQALLTPPPGSLRVDSIAGYPAACAAIRQALHGGAPITVYVCNGTSSAWLARVAAAYGESRVAWRAYAPRDVLAERWGLTLPATITDREILESQLLAATVTPRQGQIFWDVLLERFFDDALTYKILPLGSVAALCERACSEEWQAAVRQPLQARALRVKLDAWRRSAVSPALRAILNRIEQDPAGLRKDLAQFKVLRTYPSVLGSKVLGEQWDVLRSANIDSTEVALRPEDRASIVPEVEYYLSNIGQNLRNADDLATLVDQTSGYLLEEYQALESLLRQHREWLDEALVQRIEARFAPIRTGIGALLASLRRLIPPAFPPSPNLEWDVGEWLDWITNSYMPYYAWLDGQNRRDEQLAEYAFDFADWLYAHFVELKNGQPERFAFTALYAERARIASAGTISLVVMLDNFNLTYLPILARLLGDQGFSLQDSRPTLSLIPTATEVGKPCLIAGTGDVGELPESSYADLVAKEWNPLLHGGTAGYLATVGDLQELRTLQHTLYFLNFTQTDSALHEDNRQTGRPHIEVVEERLTTVIIAVTELARRFQIESRLNVYFVSDHGSTRIPQQTVNVLDKDFFKGLALDKHHRYIALSDARFADLPQVADAQCYLLGREKFKTAKNYLATRQYYRFVETKENFYVHGGLTPEEVVVPFVHATRAPLVPIAPSVHLLGSQFRYAVPSRVILEMGNPNGFAIDGLSIRLLDTDAEEWTLSTLGPKQPAKAEIRTVFRKTVGAPASRSLTVRLRYTCQGKQYGPQDQTFKITLKSLMEETDEFDL